eukprot:TRINITY_DN67340_c0_g1_i1.p1 TRINITY_DN67340_c0_g1~~TRINITY_DN67340_c0_g1_i1.p1  ORF type:complete len:373 (+),score=80.09 TRINITY_DN67340_c0_g1_i1:99-1121(+)
MAAANASATLQGTMPGRSAMTQSARSFQGGKTLEGSTGAPLMMNATAPPASKDIRSTMSRWVNQAQLMLFVFPSTLEHPESTGRLELFARYGPVDADGKLRGGIAGSHVHTDLEIRHMIHHEVREMLFALFKKPRETVEVIVDGLMPVAMAQNYTWAEIKQMLKPCYTEAAKRGDDKLDFGHMQKIILENQKHRLQALLKDGKAALKERGPVVPYQSSAAAKLAVPTNHGRKELKKDLNQQEEQMYRQRRLHRFATLVAGLEDQNLQSQVTGNVALCRDLGGLDDRWDRYCAVRRVGKATYVKARNVPHSGGGCIDDGQGDKHPGISSLVSTGYGKGPVL